MDCSKRKIEAVHEGLLWVEQRLNSIQKAKKEHCVQRIVRQDHKRRVN